MPRALAALVLAGGALAGPVVRAQEAAQGGPAPASAPARPGDETPAPAPPPAPPPKFEGAIGLIAHVEPEFAGAARHTLGATPSIYLRYGRWTFSTSGLFVSRRKDDIFQGLGRDLNRTEYLRTHFSLRLERGGRSARSGELPNAPDTRTTVRGLFTGTWMPQGLDRADGWKVTAGLSTDLLARGGGQTLDLGLSREHNLGPGLRWSYGAGVSAASARWMRTRFEVTPEEAARTGYPAYRPGGGLRDASLGTTVRWTIDERWQVLAGVSGGRLLGPAADSPLTQRRQHWEARLGGAWSF